MTHRHDQDYHPLWIADVAAYAGQQAINRNDPGRLVRLAEKMAIREATILPVDQRPDPAQPVARSNGLDGRLAELHTRSLTLAARQRVNDLYDSPTRDPQQLDAALTRLEQMAERLGQVRGGHETWEQLNGRELPPMEDYTRPGRER
ncbi:hypothetical protein CGZ91_13030 [Parenemella sanctibonifatiensis]|uniref:Uncharacterized protein n=1 Tax=Parenemella sanctibonifatiensis TaxID=2016505 RepID=A0A255EK95_9ACTN|nr:hypothetical protein CGZ91_13030 [Parenemella sanctibonifatiensis]